MEREEARQQQFPTQYQPSRAPAPVARHCCCPHQRRCQLHPRRQTQHPRRSSRLRRPSHRRTHPAAPPLLAQQQRVPVPVPIPVPVPVPVAIALQAPFLQGCCRWAGTRWRPRRCSHQARRHGVPGAQEPQRRRARVNRRRRHRRRPRRWVTPATPRFGAAYTQRTGGGQRRSGHAVDSRRRRGGGKPRHGRRRCSQRRRHDERCFINRRTDAVRAVEGADGLVDQRLECMRRPGAVDAVGRRRARRLLRIGVLRWWRGEAVLVVVGAVHASVRRAVHGCAGTVEAP